MAWHRIGARTGSVGVVIILAAAACGGTGQGTTGQTQVSTPVPSAAAALTSPPTRTPVSSTPSPSPAGPTTFKSAVFDQPFTITLPPGWIVGEQAVDMASFFLPMGPDLGPRLGIDIQEVPRVFKNPCDVKSVEVPAGTTPGDLAAWMETWKPLHASKPVASKLSGLDALMVDEGFDGSTCKVANLWPTAGGYMDPAEHKRYQVLEVDGKRIVVTLVGRDDTWDGTLADGQKVLDSLTFTSP